MAGNEVAIANFLFKNIGKIKLKHFGIITEIGAPNKKQGDYTIIKNENELALIATSDRGKKADIYINKFGVSLKQAGPSFPYNRLQRADMLNLFNFLELKKPQEMLDKIDKEVDDFHTELIFGRSRLWNKIFDEEDFKTLVRFLMITGSPRGESKHKAEYILEAPGQITGAEDIDVYTFDEYFEKYKNNIFIGVRRQWIGQASKSEHSRAFGLAKKADNKKWVYDDIKGTPDKHRDTGLIWKPDWDEANRKTVYMIFIEKK